MIYKRKKFSLIFVSIIIITSLFLSACGNSKTEHSFTLAQKDLLPEFLDSAPLELQEAYQFAIANPDILSQFPCYCGCGGMGHMSNLDCYIQEFAEDGTIIFENHAYG